MPVITKRLNSPKVQPGFIQQQENTCSLDRESRAEMARLGGLNKSQIAKDSQSPLGSRTEP